MPELSGGYVCPTTVTKAKWGVRTTYTVSQSTSGGNPFVNVSKAGGGGKEAR